MVFAIRDLVRYEEFLQVRDVQQQIWGFAQGEGLYPPILKTASENGGVVIGAFDGPAMTQAAISHAVTRFSAQPALAFFTASSCIASPPLG